MLLQIPVYALQKIANCAAKPSTLRRGHVLPWSGLPMDRSVCILKQPLGAGALSGCTLTCCTAQLCTLGTSCLFGKAFTLSAGCLCLWSGADPDDMQQPYGLPEVRKHTPAPLIVLILWAKTSPGASGGMSLAIGSSANELVSSLDSCRSLWQCRGVCPA